MIRKILIVLAALIVVFVIVAALQPSTSRVERSATLALSPAAAFTQTNDLRRYAE